MYEDAWGLMLGVLPLSSMVPPRPLPTPRLPSKTYHVASPPSLLVYLDPCTVAPANDHMHLYITHGLIHACSSKLSGKPSAIECAAAASEDDKVYI
jgi:hypothetical protein